MILISTYPASTKVGTLKISTKNKSTNGTLDLDAMITGIYGTIGRDAAPAGLLPPPPAPSAQFRASGG